MVYQSKEKCEEKGHSKKENKPNKVVDKIQIDVDITTKTIIYEDSNNSVGIDHRTRRRLKRGKMSIDGRLDLHGKTQNEAYDTLLEYIPVAYASGKRCILVITGKGLPRSGDIKLIERSDHIGILKQKTPQWLSMPPLSPYILDIQTAQPNHGGEGALYVLLRRKRKQ
jgi:DNA-nicking Smr family endonuclease